LGQLILLIAQATAEPLSTFRSDISPQLEQWMSRALKKEPSLRFQNAREMSEALGAAVGASRVNDAMDNPPAFVSGSYSQPQIQTNYQEPSASIVLAQSVEPAQLPQQQVLPETMQGTRAMTALQQPANTLRGTANTHLEAPPQVPMNRGGFLTMGAVALVIVVGGIIEILIWGRSSGTAESAAVPVLSASAGANAPVASASAASSNFIRPEDFPPIPAAARASAARPPAPPTKAKRPDVSKYGVP
jgi:hypothetical protein